MMLLQAILTGQIDCPSLLSAFSLNARSFRPRKPQLLCVPKSNTNYAQNSVLLRLARTYNKTYSDFDLFHQSGVNRVTIKRCCRNERLDNSARGFATHCFIMLATGPSLPSLIHGLSDIVRARLR